MDNKISFKEVVICWWSFFWRFAVILIPTLVLSGYLINFAGKYFRQPLSLFCFTLSIGLTMKILVIILVFKFIFGRKIGKFSTVLIPAKIRDSYKYGSKIKNRVIIFVSLNYVWRFAVFAFALGFIMMKCFFYVGDALDYNALELAKYSKLVGNLAVIPATFIAFVLMLWRSEKRRTLDIVRLESEVK